MLVVKLVGVHVVLVVLSPLLVIRPCLVSSGERQLLTHTNASGRAMQVGGRGAEMGDATLHALFAGEGAATSLFASLALEAAVLVSIALSVVVGLEAAIVMVDGGGVVGNVGSAARSGNVSLTWATWT